MNMLRWPYPHLIAHRGGGRFAPENTAAALLAGSVFGYRMAEFDVKLSSDNIAFLLHDDTLDRTTNSCGPAADWRWAELATLDAGSGFDPRFADEPLPTLADAARICLEHGIHANVEIKPCPGREVQTGKLVAQECLRRWGRATIPPLLSSFSADALSAARVAAPPLNYAWLIEDTLPSDWLTTAQQLGVIALDIDHTLVDADLVTAIHDAGLALMCWTVDDPARAASLFRLGVDAICTDALDALQP